MKTCEVVRMIESVRPYTAPDWRETLKYNLGKEADLIGWISDNSDAIIIAIRIGLVIVLPILVYWILERFFKTDKELCTK